MLVPLLSEEDMNIGDIVRLTDSLYTMFSNNPEDYPEQLWYPWAECDSIDEATGDTLTYSCGDSIYYSNVGGASF